MRVLLRVTMIVGVAIATTVIAGPRKVLVLPVDGNADSATRAKLDAALQKLSHGIDGQVAIGDTTFADTAAAVGCDPTEASCADTVLSTLAVDELVWGTATTANGQTIVVVKRATKGAPPKQQLATIAATDSPDKAETDLGPLFGAPNVVAGSASPGSAAPVGSGSATPPLPTTAARDMGDRDLGIGLAVGAGVAVVAGLLLWESESSVQNQINAAPTNTLADITALKAIEDKAGNYAFWGNAMVVVGVGVGAASAYFLWKDHKAAHTATIAPAPADHGMTLVLGGRW